MRRLLLIAFHFPPFAGSSGVQRALQFARHLPEFGWDPVILTAHPRAYERCSNDLVAELPEGVPVIRAQAWDAKQHFSIGGRYPGFLARPDRWRSWAPGAVRAGLRAVREYNPQAIWSTFPIATAHKIGLAIAKKTGLPWIADFRDPMVQDGYPADPATFRSFVEIEKKTMSSMRLATFTTPGAVETYKRRYPAVKQRITLLENGYSEETFCQVSETGGPLNNGKITLLHSGVVYPKERDPTVLFEALRKLKSEQPEVFERLMMRFRAAGHEHLLKQLIMLNGLEGHVEILPAIPHHEAVKEMLRADGLLILQSSNCNQQIPAKLYEYMRSGRPNLVLADPEGDTAHAARSFGISAVASLDDLPGIYGLLTDFVSNPVSGTVPHERAIIGASRRARTRELARLLDSACRR